MCLSQTKIDKGHDVADDAHLAGRGRTGPAPNNSLKKSFMDDERVPTQRAQVKPDRRQSHAAPCGTGLLGSTVSTFNTGPAPLPSSYLHKETPPVVAQAEPRRVTRPVRIGPLAQITLHPPPLKEGKKESGGHFRWEQKPTRPAVAVHRLILSVGNQTSSSKSSSVSPAPPILLHRSYAA